MFLDSPGGIFCLLCCGSLYPQQLTMAVLLVLLSGLLEFLGGGSGFKIYQPTRKLRLVSREHTRIKRGRDCNAIEVRGRGSPPKGGANYLISVIVSSRRS